MRQRKSINVLVLGDENVGKSSIISSFLSRQFVPITTPGAIGKVQLPPDSAPFVGDCIITTIIDTQPLDCGLSEVTDDTGLSLDDSRDQTTTELHNFQTSSFGIDNRSINSISNLYARKLMHDIDSIVFVYDLDRPETFSRMEELWLPWIEKCREVPVIVAGNKLDVIQNSLDVNSSTIESELHPTILKSHRQIVSLLQRFKFVREVIMCSAKNLINIDEIFTQSIQVVVYPLLPLYNLDNCRLTDGCKRAFHRIFRIYDCDNDGLLSDEEIDTFQNFAFQAPLTMADFDGWKQVICKGCDDAASYEIEYESTIVRDGKFTLTGFLALFETLISQNRLEIPWKILRMFRYDDNLELHIPDSLGYLNSISHYRNMDLESLFENSCGLSTSAKNFLTDLFFRFHPDVNETLSKEGMRKIFSILQEKCPPWNPSRHAQAFSKSFSVPRVIHRISGTPSISSSVSGPSLSASGITICSLGSLSSVDTSDDSIFLTNDFSRACNFHDWIGHWYLMSSLSESFTQAELFRLGYIADRSSYGLCHTHHHTASRVLGRYLCPDVNTHTSIIPSRATRIFVFGSDIKPGRRTLVEFLSGSNLFSEQCSPTLTDEGSSVRDDKHHSFPAESCFTSVHLQHHPMHKTVVEHTSYLIFTEFHYPSRVNDLKDIMSDDHHKCDVVVFVFNTSDVSSLDYVLELEREYLSCNTPRIFIGLDPEKVPPNAKESSHDIIDTHCTKYDLEEPIIIPMNKLDEDLRERILVHLSMSVLKDSLVKLIPHGRRKRKETKFWLYIGGLSIAASVGLYSYFLTSSSSDYDVKRTKDTNRSSWLRKIFSSIKRSSFEMLRKFR